MSKFIELTDVCNDKIFLNVDNIEFFYKTDLRGSKICTVRGRVFDVEELPDEIMAKIREVQR